MPDGVFLFTYVLLWMLVILLYVAVILLYRNVGASLLRVSNQGPKINIEPIQVELRRLGGRPFVLGSASGRFQFVFFGSSTCGYCANAILQLKSVASSYDDVETIVIYKGEESVLSRIHRHLPEGYIFLADSEAESFVKWNIKSTPFSVLIDPAGVIRKKGVSSTKSDLEAFFLAVGAPKST